MKKSTIASDALDRRIVLAAIAAAMLGSSVAVAADAGDPGAVVSALSRRRQRRRPELERERREDAGPLEIACRAVGERRQEGGSRR